MSIAALIRSMAAAGASSEAIALAIEAVEAVESKIIAQREAARDRKRRQRAKPDDVTGQSRDTAGTVTPTSPPSRPLSPQTPLSPTHSPPDVTTRARETEAFGKFWSAYPRKVSKSEARKAFARAFRKLPAFDEESILIGGLERAKAGWVDAQFIPHAATWLNGERWQDEPDPPAPRSPNGQRPHPDHKHDAYRDKLLDVGAAMDAAFEQSRREH